MTFRLKTVLTIVVLTALALGGAFSAVSAAFNRLQREQLDASLLSVALQEAREAPLHHFSFTDGPGPAANDVGPLTKYGIIYDVGGSVLSATPPFDRKPLNLSHVRRAEGRPFDLSYEGGRYRGVLMSIHGHPGKVLFLAASRDDLDGDESFLHRAMLVAFLMALLWVAALAYWMGGRLTLAHNDIAEVVRRVSAGDLAARVKVRASDPEVNRLGREINEMVARLDELLTAQQRFIAHAAHELRTPLAALYGELQQARRKPREPAYYERTLDAALDAARHLTTLAEDLLTLAKSRGGDPKPSARTPLREVIADAWAPIADLARARQVVLAQAGDLSESVPTRAGDTTRLFRNLLHNAVRHSPAAGRITLTATRQGRNVEVRIVDEGAGVASADREAIFEPFFRAAHAPTNDGAGLGLGIAREIARAHGGDVTLDTATDSSGACFVIRLPRAHGQ